MAESTRLVDLVQARSRTSSQNARPFSRSISPDLEPLDDVLTAVSQRRQALPRAVLLLGLAGGRRHDGFDPFADGRRARPLAASSRRRPRSSSSTPPRSCTTTSSTTPTPAGARRRRTGGSRRCTRESGWAGDAGDFGRASAHPARRPAARLERRAARRGLSTRCPTATRPRRPRASSTGCAPRSPPGSTSTSSRSAPGRRSPTPSSSRARDRVIVYKSAKYSVESPARDRRRARRRDRRAARRAARVRAPARHRLPAARRPARRVRRPRGHRQARGRRPARGQAHDAHRARPRRSLAAGQRRLLDELLGDPDLDDEQIGCCSARSARAAPSTRSSAIIARQRRAGARRRSTTRRSVATARGELGGARRHGHPPRRR